MEDLMIGLVRNRKACPVAMAETMVMLHNYIDNFAQPVLLFLIIYSCAEGST